MRILVYIPPLGKSIPSKEKICLSAHAQAVFLRAQEVRAALSNGLDRGPASVFLCSVGPGCPKNDLAAETPASGERDPVGFRRTAARSRGGIHILTGKDKTDRPLSPAKHRGLPRFLLRVFFFTYRYFSSGVFFFGQPADF